MVKVKTIVQNQESIRFKKQGMFTWIRYEREVERSEGWAKGCRLGYYLVFVVKVPVQEVKEW